MMNDLLESARQVPLQPVKLSCMDKTGIELLIRRDDLVDEALSGNKYYKLYFNLTKARSLGYGQLLSFGGAYSNHLYALAAAGKRYGLTTLGVVRGERPECLSQTLSDAERWGMRLVFVSRADYRTLTQVQGESSALLQAIKDQYGDFLTIPEGGANPEGAAGMQVLGSVLHEQLNGDYASVCLACGTGTGLAGVAAGVARDKTVLGFSVLKGSGTMASVVSEFYRQLAPTSAQLVDNWRLISGFHGGGYGRRLPAALQRFWQEFEQETGLLLDPVYTIKMFWGITRLAQQGYWPKGSRVVAVHTGGLQGRRGFATPWVSNENRGK